MSKKENWVWMPHPGHFILSNRCKFVLNTYVGGYIVSTVGELDSDSAIKHIHSRIHDPVWDSQNARLKGDSWDAAYFKRFGYDDIGYKRKYETMVFKARREQDPEWQCCPWVIQVSDDVDSAHWEDNKSAREGHMKLCNKWSKKLTNQSTAIKGAK